MSWQAGASTRTAELLSAAARLTIGVGDRLDVGRRFSRADVWPVRRQRPRWLSAAHRAHGVRQQARAEKRGTESAAMVDAGGFTGPDEGCERMIPDVDDAYRYVLMAQNVSDEEFG